MDIMYWLLNLLVLSQVQQVNSRLVEFSGVAGNSATAVAVSNTALLNMTLAKLRPGDTLHIPNKTYWMMGGIRASGLESVTIQLDGTLSFSKDIKAWPASKPGSKMPQTCIQIENTVGLVITSNGTGTLEGNGATWWGLPGIGYLERGKNRPAMMSIRNATRFLLENILFHQAPRFNFVSRGLRDAIIRHSTVSARRTSEDGHGAIDLTAFNTDGFDVSGQNIHIHDCSVWNQDDTFAIKAEGENTSNVLIERVRASGVGLTIGSIGDNHVRNVTFRDVTMHHTSKGVYIKFRSSASKGGVIENVLYENIYVDKPSSWPIWIGPAQQDIKENKGPYNPCHGDPCSLCWCANHIDTPAGIHYAMTCRVRPSVKTANCNSVPGLFRNITLRNITVNKPSTSAVMSCSWGVIFGNNSNPIQNLVFDGVRFIDPPADGVWGNDYYFCEGVQNGVALGGTWPVPPCFRNGSGVMHTREVR